MSTEGKGHERALKRWAERGDWTVDDLFRMNKELRDRVGVVEKERDQARSALRDIMTMIEAQYPAAPTW